MLIVSVRVVYDLPVPIFGNLEGRLIAMSNNWLCFIFQDFHYVYQKFDPHVLWQGLKRTDQQSILDDYNKRGARTTQPSFNSVMPAVSSTSIAPVLSSPAAPGIILSGEEVLARAAAFGRGFSATGFKKFLALTEAAKDQKDGTLRKFFVG